MQLIQIFGVQYRYPAWPSFISRDRRGKVLDYSEYYAARGILDDLLRRDILGPVHEDEVLEEAPHQSYIAGRLFPRNMFLKPEEAENSSMEEIDPNDQTMDLCYSYYPSSMALSFTIINDVEEVVAEVNYAWYLVEPLSGRNVQWRRKSNSVVFNIRIKKEAQTIPVCDGLDLKIFLQKEYKDGSKTLTVALINNFQAEMDFIRNNEHTFFQPSIVIHSNNEGQAIFEEKQYRVKLNSNDEVLNLEMLYRHNKSFATGHGCSVNWISDSDYASKLWTEFLPSEEVLQMQPALNIDNRIRAFSFLASASQEEMCSELEEISKEYYKWIQKEREKVAGLPKKYHRVALINFDECETSHKRIQNGIELIKKDFLVFRAFQLVNQAMINLRIKAKSDNPHDESWYPFQLAFILQEISSIADPNDPYRNIVDLLWFPTGGGKTEAYLGLTAFTVFLRRMKASLEKGPGHGVTVLMRYTLRLLTLQQFERAASLICACELLRKDNPELGNNEISIGMWVGYETTPTKRTEAKKALKIIEENGPEFLQRMDNAPANPVQLLECPWCKTKLSSSDYRVTNDQMIISCPDDSCEFHRRLPVYLVDEDVYDFRPSLIIATVDKFARITWQTLVGNLFGVDKEVHPPELIIQDELHLIAGPLGTITGLYETVIDELTNNEGIKAKIISSTATIRNAGSQIKSLFGRDYIQFPPQGIDIRDSFFAVEAKPHEKPARLYTAILAPGSSGNTLLIRCYAILLFGVRYLRDRNFSEEIIDSFWTLTGYFNSLKQLGGAVINVLDDVSGRLKYLQKARFSYLPGLDILEEYSIKPPEELNSHRNSSEIAETLKLLETNYPSNQVIDVVLASNMLSVGIDIGRLGLMVLQGQPKLNSEYIQATSRVGRQTPGLVIMLNDASRSRDRSHYEQFKTFHSTLYKYVEATSLTPFADRARDRALHAVLISLCRQRIDGLQRNTDVRNIENYHDEVKIIINSILNRVSNVDNDEINDTRAHLLAILEYWDHMASKNPRLAYQKFSKQDTVPFLTMHFDTIGDALPTLNSMRNVDIECTVKLLEG